MTRGDRYREQAKVVQKFAVDAKDADVKRQFIELAAQWRNLARQADEHDEFMSPRHEAEDDQR